MPNVSEQPGARGEYAPLSEPSYGEQYSYFRLMPVRLNCFGLCPLRFISECKFASEEWKRVGTVLFYSKIKMFCK